MWPALRRDQADLQGTDRHAAVRAVDVGIHPRAALQLQDVLGFVQRPDPGEGGVEAIADDLRAAVKHRAEIVDLRYGDADLGRKHRESLAFLTLLLRALALAHVLHDAFVIEDLPLPIAHDARADLAPDGCPVTPTQPRLEVTGDSLPSEDLDQALAFPGIGVELGRIDLFQLLRIGKAEHLGVSRVDLEQSPVWTAAEESDRHPIVETVIAILRVLDSLPLCGHLDGDRHLRADLERDLPLLRRQRIVVLDPNRERAHQRTRGDERNHYIVAEPERHHRFALATLGGGAIEQVDLALPQVFEHRGDVAEELESKALTGAEPRALRRAPCQHGGTLGHGIELEHGRSFAGDQSRNARDADLRDDRSRAS